MQLLLRETDRGRRETEGRNGWLKTKQWPDVIVCVCVCVPALWLHFKDGPFGTPHLRICQFMSLRISDRAGGRRTFCFCFVLIQWRGQTAVQFEMMIDDVCCITARRGHETRLGLLAGASPEPVLSLPLLPWLRSGSKVRRPRERV